MAQAVRPTKKRSPYYDNLKYVLITLVVVGHMLNTWLGEADSRKTYGLDGGYIFLSVMTFIYLFHMPAFMFTGGLFAKKMYTPERGLNVNMVTYYAVLYIIMYTGLHLLKCTYSTPTFDLLHVGGIPWYMFAMAVLMASTAIVSNVKAGAKLVIPASFLFAMVASFSPDLGVFLSFGRIVNFAPFFFIGYFLDAKKLEAQIVKLKGMHWPPFLAAFVLVGIGATIYFCLPYEVTNALLRISFGVHPFAEVAKFNLALIILLWIGHAVLAVLMTLCVCLLVPMGRTFFSEGGSRTLQVYLLHPFVYYPLNAFGGMEAFYQSGIPLQIVWIVLFGVVLAWVLSIPKTPARLLNKLKDCIRIQKDERVLQAAS